MNLINFKIIPGPELVEEPARLHSIIINLCGMSQKIREN